MLALFGCIVLAPLLYVPGFLIAHVFQGVSPQASFLDRQFERVVAGALLNGWLVFTLAELGVFSVWLHVVLVVVVCGCCVGVMQRRGMLLLLFRSGGGQRAGGEHRCAVLFAQWDTLAFIAWGLVFVCLVARPFEVVLGARDAGVYANIGFAIARTGGIVQHDAVLAQIGQDQEADDEGLRAAAAQAETNFLGVQDRQRFLATRLRVAGFFVTDADLTSGRVVPQFFHLYPAWIGLLAGFLGLRGGLLATGLMGLLGLWGVGMVSRRLISPWAGVLAVGLLALNGVQVWFSRYSTSETTAQFLTFAGVYAFAVAQTAGATTHQGQRRFHALLAGVAFGQMALTRIEFLLVIGPLVVYLIYRWFSRRWEVIDSWMVVGAGVMVFQAALHVVLVARDYFFSTLFARLQDQSAIIATLSLPFLTPELRRVFVETPRSVLRNPNRLWIELVVVVVLGVVVFLLRRDGRLVCVCERLVQRYRSFLLGASAFLIFMVACYGYFVRPQILTMEVLAHGGSCFGVAQFQRPDADCLALQGYIGAPIVPPSYPNVMAYAFDTFPKRLLGVSVPSRLSDAMALNDKIAIYQANMVRVGWYLSPLGVILGFVGFALWWRRGMGRATWFFFAIALATSVFFIRQSYGTSEATYIYILRRYVPQVYPAFCMGAAYAITGLASWRPGVLWLERWPRMAAGMLVVGLVSFLVVTNRPMYAHVEYEGALDQLAATAHRFEQRDVLLFRGGGPTYADARDKPDLVVTPLTYAFGLNAFTIKSKEPDKYADSLARYVQRWRSEGRQVYLALGASGGVELPGFSLERIDGVTLHLPEFEQLSNQKPRNIQMLDIDFTIYRLDPVSPPPIRPTSVGVDDYAMQVRGFYHPEEIGAARLAWTDGDALLRFPWSAQDALSISLNLAGGKRPPPLGAAHVCLSLHTEQSTWAQDPNAVFVPLGCFDLPETMTTLRLSFDPRRYPLSTTGFAVLRFESASWRPMLIDPALHDQRPLGIQFGGLSVHPAKRVSVKRVLDSE